MSWTYLAVAGLFEVVWAVLLKSTEGFTRPLPGAGAIALVAVSFYCLAQAQRTISVPLVATPWVIAS